MTALNESLSDADTQEPVKSELNSRHVPDSDDDSVDMAPVKKSSEKAAAAIEPIHSDSDHSDDERTNDPPVDFGEEEEEDDFAPQNEKKNKSPVRPKQEDDSKLKGDADEKGNPCSSDTHRTKRHQKKSDGSRSPSPKKKTKSKAKALSPSKAIKKVKLDSKTKPKPVKSKQPPSKKSSQPTKSKNGSSDVSQKPSSNISTASSPRKSPKSESANPANTSKTKPLLRKASKPSQKAGTSAQQKSKSLKVKKAIDKDDATKEKKSPTSKKGKTATTVNTFSKKAKKGTVQTTKSPPKGQKESNEKKAKQKKSSSAKSPKSSKKGKTDDAEEKDDGDESAQMEIDSENDEPVSENDSCDEETVRTPSFKMQLLGNLACSSRDQNTQALLEHAVQQLRRYNIVSYNAETSSPLIAYIIGKETRRGWGVLQALVSGVALVSDNWLSSSISEGKWVPMDDFRSDRFGQSPRSVNSAAEGPAKLLDGLRVRVISNDKDAASIRKVVRLCGARLAETRVDVVINDSKKKVEGCPNVQKKWLADSIESGVPLDYEPYLIGGG
ncbi:hypothetical protein BWQ96_02100 [Gracilariopsis chorda]|uniref:BRCT domain-containing protein n=1 Tax=Gracilariopsis chorda TaxID=448386 RepID=A0A2V3J199_9FLOR|nr:hypothetical protein BWQ96_02100 [Gracilariopsis chorda]|eukprot:PXF48148.1 hypothetical protein BWQ96_02100 [Gracilariopsis chorda]